MSYNIGISAYYHDSSVALLKNGELVFACEEEKFTGIKHDSSFPNNVLKYCIEKYGITNSNLEKICFYESPNLKWDRVWRTSLACLFRNPVYSVSNIVNFAKTRFNFWLNTKKFGRDKIFYSNHHHSHLYYSAASSPYKRSVVLSLDGVGEWDTAKAAVWNNGKLIDLITLGTYPHSLGLFYSAMTAFLGFRPNEGEYKVMGLSAYGRNSHFINKMEDLIWFEGGEIKCNMDYFSWDTSGMYMFNNKLSEFLGINFRLPNEDITRFHKNLAYAVQYKYESMFFQILNWIYDRYNCKELILGGGCAYNGLANGKIYSNTKFLSVWIPPAPSDAGSAIGAVCNYLVNRGLQPIIPKTPFLGPEFQFNGGGEFKWMGLDKLYPYLASKIKDGKVVGWYWGRIEFGARALGNRSILADPTSPIMKDRINELIKRREGFRPFAPMVTAEKHAKFFDWNRDIPYMNQVVNVRPEWVSVLNSVTHIDGTARVQTVYDDNSIYPLLLEFEKLTGFPILLNTSFNIKDKTIVLTPDDAIETFFQTDLDILVINGYIIEK